MYKPINGFTKAKILEILKARKHTEPASTSDGLSCVYLSDDGNKCAVGMFIPDGHPGQKMTGVVTSLLKVHPDLAALMPLPPDVMYILQTYHDQLDPSEDAKALMIGWVETNVADDEIKPEAA